MARMLLASSIFVAMVTTAAASPIGEWLVADQSARVAIARCGPDLCGKISWSSDGKDLGRAILIHMKPDGTQWTGTVVDVRDGQKYLAHIQMQTERQLKLDGCALGGIVCQGEVWTRTR